MISQELLENLIFLVAAVAISCIGVIIGGHVSHCSFMRKDPAKIANPLKWIRKSKPEEKQNAKKPDPRHT